MAAEHARGFGQKNLKRRTPDLQICGCGLTILALKPTANLPLLPASGLAAHAAPHKGQSLSSMGWATRGTSTTCRVGM